MRRILRKGIIKLSKIKLLRNKFNFLNTYYKAFILDDKNSRILIESARVGRMRSLYFWRWAPRKYWGGALLNLLGLSLIRYYYHNSKYLLRFTNKKIFDDELNTNGITIKTNFINSDLVDEVLEFYHKKSGDICHHFEDFSELTISNTKGVQKNDPDYKNLADKILNQVGIIEIGKKLTGKNFSIYPFISILKSKSTPSSLNQQDGQDTPHVDVFYPSYKIFIYLNHVSEENGAFRYLKGSHEFSFRNAINYYKDTFRHYFLGGNQKIYPTDATVNLYKNDFQWKSANGKPGDAVFFNVQGIHRRGDFKKDTSRERLVLLIDFRQAEVPIQMLAANV